MLNRNREIDILKGLLVLVMVYGHCIQFFIQRHAGDAFANAFAEFASITVFSSFMFCFGFVCRRAYIDKPYKKAAKSLGINIIKLVAAYYISGFTFMVFIERIRLFNFPWSDLLLFRRLIGWSEFILSFAAVLVLILIFHYPMKKAGKTLPLILAAVSVVACLLPFRVGEPILAIFLGRADFPVFAVIPYFILFAAGMWISEREKFPRWQVISGCVVCGLYFLIILFTRGGYMPSRFPVSLAWVAGGVPAAFLYYLLSRLIVKVPVLGSGLASIGSYSLFYLLMSNVFIFALFSVTFYMPTHAFTFIAFVAMMAAMWYLHNLCFKKVRKPSS